MPTARYWRIVGISTPANGVLELSEIQLYAAGVRVGAAITPSCPFIPLTGTLTDLNDGSAAGVVSWPYAEYSSPGFALMWDLTGAGADVGALRIGSGNSADTYPLDLTWQFSDDASTWTTFSGAVNAAYPGPLTLVAAPTMGIDTDSYASNVSLLLHMDGGDGSTSFIDTSPRTKTVTAGGTTRISTAKRKFGESSGFYDQGGTLLSPAHTDYDPENLDFTAECNVYQTDAAGGGALFGPDYYQNLIGTCQIGTAANSGFNLTLASGRPLMSLYNVAGTADTSVFAASAIALNTWVHLAFVRQGTTMALYVNGVLAASGSFSGPTCHSTRPLAIGCDSTGSARFAGYMDEIRMTKGVARYTANFTPPAAPFGANPMVFLPTDNPLPPRLRCKPFALDHMAGTPQGSGAASGHLRESPFFDAYNGGIGVVYGTVKEKSTPDNTPLRRRVLLIDEASRMAIRETWSDARTGNYEFRGVKEGVTYTVISYDHTGAYRAVVADHQVPELIV